MQLEERRGVDPRPVYLRPFVDHPGLQVLHQQLEQLHKLRVGQLVHIDCSQHIQESLAPGLPVGVALLVLAGLGVVV